MITLWLGLALAAVWATADLHDRHPQAWWAQLLHVAGASWFVGVWLAFFLPGG